VIRNHYQFPKLPEYSKAGITLHVNPKDEKEPVELSIQFKNSNSETETPEQDDSVTMNAQGRLSFTIGTWGSIELFAENSGPVKTGSSIPLEDI
jgi:hypothetical protein